MIANWLKILLFAAGGITAAAGTAYYTGIYDPWASRDTGSPVASAPDSAAPAGGAATGDRPVAVLEDEDAAGAPAPAPQTDAPSQDAEIAALPEADDSAETTQTGEGEDLAIPSFHIVRVEPNGSMVIAGSAEPNSEIEVVAGAHVIARADVGPSGDFAAVLDDSLDPGDYQIVLRSTGPDEGQVTTSLETAIVSVPDNSSGQVLALVEEPGAASRLITVPEAQAMQEDANAADEAEREIAEAGQTQAATDTPDEQAESATETDAATDEAEVARVDPEPAEVAPSRPATPRNTLAVEAIEIEGRSVFVAGRGTAGTTVRVYANDILLGEAQVSEAGRFLIETHADLAVGDYIVRADVIGPGGEVTARAAVPFQREPGETVAAVAPRESAASADTGAGDEREARPADVDAPQTQADTSQPGSGAATSPETPEAGKPAATPQTDAVTTPETPRTVPTTDSASAAIEETMSPGLQSVDGSVIIRRGDTLWRISRRVYGRGVRYSTIYLANQDQIRDPDMIWPGQIFAVPEETEEGERADMSTVSDQLAPQTSTE